MASYAVQVAKHATLGAATVDTVSLAGYGRYIQVINRGAADPIYFTAAHADRIATPAAAADDTFVVTSGTSVIIPYPIDCTDACSVKLISAGAMAYSVQIIGDRIV